MITLEVLFHFYITFTKSFLNSDLFLIYLSYCVIYQAKLKPRLSQLNFIFIFSIFRYKLGRMKAYLI